MQKTEGLPRTQNAWTENLPVGFAVRKQSPKNKGENQ